MVVGRHKNYHQFDRVRAAASESFRTDLMFRMNASRRGAFLKKKTGLLQLFESQDHRGLLRDMNFEILQDSDL